jgi:hypothetical protein
MQDDYTIFEEDKNQNSQGTSNPDGSSTDTSQDYGISDVLVVNLLYLTGKHWNVSKSSNSMFLFALACMRPG